jgi:hypothetical protein
MLGDKALQIGIRPLSAALPPRAIIKGFVAVGAGFSIVSIIKGFVVSTVARASELCHVARHMMRKLLEQ